MQEKLIFLKITLMVTGGFIVIFIIASLAVTGSNNVGQNDSVEVIIVDQ